MIFKRLILWCLIFITHNVFANKALILSDIHFTPFANCSALPLFCTKNKQLEVLPVSSWTFKDSKPNEYREETNSYFLINALDSLGIKLKTESSFDIFVTGDLLAHSFDEQYRYYYNPFASKGEVSDFSYKTISYVLFQIHKAFPKSSIYYVLGNNDTDTQDYNLPTDEWLHKVAKSAAANLPHSEQADFISQFSSSGYYSLALSGGVQLIGLNINPLSNKATDNKSKQVAQDELIWLEKQLSIIASSKRHAIILQHIPLGIDVYKTSQRNQTIMLLDSQLQSKYLGILKKYSQQVSIIYAGHFHSEYWQEVYNIPVMGTLSFNTLFGNHGGAKLVNYDTSNGKLNNYVTYVVAIGNKTTTWQELYNYPNSYSTTKQLGAFIKDLPYQISDTKVKQYRLFYNGGVRKYPQPISNDIFWKNYYCFLNNINLAEFKNCIAKVNK
ncbi:MAG: hypothetical protein LW807_00515 [Proteobacteria bacterium]|jgi:hypothetical protein|nr:hypothetical protein [Pseudomonadota bacterium]